MNKKINNHKAVILTLIIAIFICCPGVAFAEPEVKNTIQINYD